MNRSKKKAPKKAKPVPAWIITLREGYDACESGTKNLMQYATLQEAWEKSVNPIDMQWAFDILPTSSSDFNKEELDKLRSDLFLLFEGFHLGAPKGPKGYGDWPLKARKALCKYIRTYYPMPKL